MFRVRGVVPGVITLGLSRARLANRRRGRLRLQVTLKQNRGRHAIHDPFALPTAHIGGDQQFFRRLGRHPLIPGNDGNRKRDRQLLDKVSHRLNGRPLFSVEPQGQSQQNLPDLMCAH